MVLKLAQPISVYPIGKLKELPLVPIEDYEDCFEVKAIKNERLGLAKKLEETRIEINKARDIYCDLEGKRNDEAWFQLDLAYGELLCLVVLLRESVKK